MDGISFIVRVRNEEETLEASLRSLKDLTIPHEIVVILHLCTDRSREIAESLKDELLLKIIEYNVPISRAGYETMVTDGSSQHSLAHYYNWCFSHAKHLWKFKWDADFVSSPELIDYLNSNSWIETPPTKVYFLAKNDEMSNGEGYLFTGDSGFKKYYFWEVIDGLFEIFHTNIIIHHVSKLSNIKKYWSETHWFSDHDSDEARIIRDRYNILCNICGGDVVGAARASDVACDNLFHNILQHEPELANHGIHAAC